MTKVWKLFLLLLAFGSLKAQDGSYVEVRDFETWTSAEFNFKPSKKLSFGLQQQVRLDNNSSELKNTFTQASASYALFKNFELEYGLRYIAINDNSGAVQGYNYDYRHHFDLSFKHKIKPLRLNHRLRYTTRNEAGLSSEEGDMARQTLRYRMKIDYNIKKWKLDPILSGELFNRFENGINEGISDYRITFGTEYNLKKAGKIGIYYRFEKELNTSYPMEVHLIRLKYSFTLKNY